MGILEGWEKESESDTEELSKKKFCWHWGDSETEGITEEWSKKNAEGKVFQAKSVEETNYGTTISLSWPRHRF